MASAIERVVTLLVLGFAASACRAVSTERTVAPPPNFLIVLADDMSWSDCGAYGSEQAHTPHLDRLAAEGMRFDLAFTPTAMCAPSRQALYTGLYPVRSGAYPNHSKVQPGTRSVVHHLRERGYRVGLIGKKHFGPTESFPFDQPGKGEKLSMRERVRQYIDGDPEQPWCLIVASSHPHAPWKAGEHEYDPAALALPPPMVDNAETRDAYARYLREVTAVDRQLGDCLEELDAAGARESTLVLFSSEQGPQFPGGKWTCYDWGLRTAFVARLPGVIEAGSTTAAMVQYVDVVPTLVELAGGDPSLVDTGRPDADSDHGFDGRSLARVLRGEAATHRDVIFGVHTTKGIIEGMPYPIRCVRDRQYKYIENLLPDAEFCNVETVQDRQGYWGSWTRDADTDSAAAERVARYRRRPPAELYDVVADPYEQTNLIGDPTAVAVVDRLRPRLHEWMRQQGDAGVATEEKVEFHSSVKKRRQADQ